MMSDNYTFYIFGDIEEKDKTLEDVVKCIERHKGKNMKFVFLGDIYTPKSSRKSITNIKKFFELFDYEEIDYLTVVKKYNKNNEKLAALQEIRKIFNKISIELNLNIYNHLNKFKQTMTYDFRNESFPLEKSFVFLLGNKEIDLIRDLSNFTFGRIDEQEFYTIFKYNFKHIEHKIEISFTLNELNTLINYFLLCKNYILIDDILLTHMYVNGKTLIQKSHNFNSVKRIISGHNRCYGIYYDITFPNVTIYMLDLTHEKNDLMIKNFIIYSKGNLEYVTWDKIIREMLKIKLPANDFFLKGKIDETNDISTLEYFIRCSEIMNGKNYNN